MSALPNMKTFVQAVFKPFLKALKCFYDRQTAVIIERGIKNDESVAQVQTGLTEALKRIDELSAIVIKQQTEIETLRNVHGSLGELNKMYIRERQLEHICYQLYSIVYELLTKGVSSRRAEDMLDYNNPQVSDPEAQMP